MARPQITMGEAVAQYQALRTDLSPASRRQIHAALQLLLKTTGRDLNVRSLSAKHLEAHFITGVLARAKMVAPRTFNKERLYVMQFLNFMRSRNWLDGDPMVNVRNMKPKPRQHLWLSVDELMFCLEDQEHPRDRLIIALGLNTALRSSEIASLRVGDVDLDQGWLYTTMHKNNKVDCFPITADLDGELRRWLTWYGNKMGGLKQDYLLVPARKRVPVTLNESGLYRPAPDPDGGVSPYSSCLDNIRVPLHRSLVRLGYDPRQEGMHTLRRSVARIYYDSLVEQQVDDPLRVTQQLLNHSSAVTTERYLGVERERRVRDESLRGRPFLSRLVAQHDNVVRLGGQRDGSGSGS